MKMSKKKLLAITLTLTTFLTMFAIMRPAISTEVLDLDAYCWIEGVLHSDTYTLYPYAQESLDFGFSKYGEMIGYNEDTEIGLGIQYPGFESAAEPDDAPAGTYDQRLGTSVDPFCNEEIGVDWWMNGWFIDIKYTPLGGATDREIWAFALFSDGAQHGGDWIVMPSVASTSPARPLWQEHPPYASPDSTSYSLDPNYLLDIPASGGRKTNGHCETEDIEIIYNGPRRFIAITRTKISDVGAAADLVDITFTFIFNKAEKNVIILKDVKRLYKKSPMNIQFGNRGEWDLGISPDTDSYIHWYTDHPVQYWDQDGLGTITETEEANSFEFFKDYMINYKHPKKWWDEVPASEMPTQVFDEWTEEMVDFPATWLETQPTCYGRDWHKDSTIKDHSYAVAQVISKAGDYVGALAVWPHPEFWAAHNLYYPPDRTRPPLGVNPSSIGLMLAPISRMLEWNEWTVVEDTISDDHPHGYMDDREDIWVKMDDVVTAAGGTKEPIIPFTIYEHDFQLDSSVPAYRIASVYMLTDRHDGDDLDATRGLNAEDWSDGVNQIDREIQYQLDEIFDPWDIYDAMHKNQKRWVQFFVQGVATPATAWTSTNQHAWDGELYHCIELDAERTVEEGLRIPSLPVYPGTEPGVRPTDWANDRGLTWDAYCAFTERVLVDSGSGYELVPRAVGGPILGEPADLSPDELTSYNFLDPTPDEYRHYYTIDFNTGRICFYEWNDVTEIFEAWYLPEDSVVKVLWSSEHHATTAEQWDSNDWEYSDYWKLYPLDGVTFRFPLHHDILPKYKNLTEVFLIEQLPERLPDTDPGSSLPFYTRGGDTTLQVDHVPMGKEVDIKYYSYDSPNSWHEEKFVCDNADVDTFTTAYTMDYIEKVWIHSEKAITDGDYVFNNATQTLYMQDPVADGEWLLVNYTISNDKYCDFFLGDGSTTAFELHHGGTTPTAYHDYGSLNVSNTETLQQIVNYTGDESALGIRVPKIKTEIWWTDASGVTDTYEYASRERWGIWEEREWIHVTENKTRGNWIIRETSTCDELVIDQAPLNETQTADGWPGQELKIVFKVPSGRWEWGTVGKTAATVDSLGATMVVAAFKNKLIEFGLGGMDIQDATFGPRIPWTIREDISPDSIGRYHLHDDWCYTRIGDTSAMDSSWPIASSNIITVGGPYPNMNSKYFNEFAQAMIFCNVDGVAGADDGFYAVTCWDKALSEHGFYEGGEVTDRYGYAVISTYKDKNGTIGFMVYGWTGQDTYYASKWFDEQKFVLQHLNLHVTDLILEIEYKDSDGDLYCSPLVDIVEKLGTISEKPQHDC